MGRAHVLRSLIARGQAQSLKDRNIILEIVAALAELLIVTIIVRTRVLVLRFNNITVFLLGTALPLILHLRLLRANLQEIGLELGFGHVLVFNETHHHFAGRVVVVVLLQHLILRLFHIYIILVGALVMFSVSLNH